MIKHSMKGFPDEPQVWQDSLEALLLNAVDEIERARLQPKIGLWAQQQHLRPHPLQPEDGGDKRL